MPTINPALGSSLMSVHPSSYRLIVLRALNIITLLSFFISIVHFTVHSQPSFIDIYNDHSTYFTPSLIFIGIFWLILFFLQFGYAFHAQFNNLRLLQGITEKVVSRCFYVSNLLMCAWLAFWMNEKFILSELFIFLTLITTLIGQKRLIVKYIANHRFIPTYIIIFAHVQFSMFSAFSTFALFQNGFIVLSQYGYDDVKLAITSAFLLAIIGILWCTTGVFSNKRRDFISNLTIAWLLIGVGIQQNEKSLSITCYVLAFIQIIVMSFIILKELPEFSRILGNSGERESLLQTRPRYYGGLPIINNWQNREGNDTEDLKELFQNKLNFYGGIIIDHWNGKHIIPVSEV